MTESADLIWVQNSVIFGVMKLSKVWLGFARHRIERTVDHILTNVLQ